MAKIIKKIVDIIFILIIIMLVGYGILAFTKKVEIYNVETGSMEDNIHAGDYILIYKKNNYEIGDIVTFRKNNYLVTHRIVKKNNEKFITKGDANNTEDEAINKERIVGKVILVGGILNFLINYKYTFVGLFLVIYLLSCYFDSKEKENNKEKQK